MTTHQAFFESSCLIDTEVGISFKHLDLREKSDCDTKQQAKRLLEELRERLRSSEGICFEMSQESKQRIIALLPTE